MKFALIIRNYTLMDFFSYFYVYWLSSIFTFLSISYLLSLLYSAYTVHIEAGASLCDYEFEYTVHWGRRITLWLWWVWVHGALRQAHHYVIMMSLSTRTHPPTLLLCRTRYWPLFTGCLSVISLSSLPAQSIVACVKSPLPTCNLSSKLTL